MTVDLEAIKAALAAATPGPWRVCHYMGRDIIDTRIETDAPAESWSVVFAVDGSAMIADRDADLICLLRNQAAALVAEVERLRPAIPVNVPQ